MDTNNDKEKQYEKEKKEFVAERIDNPHPLRRK